MQSERNFYVNFAPNWKLYHNSMDDNKNILLMNEEFKKTKQDSPPLIWVATHPFCKNKCLVVSKKIEEIVEGEEICV